MKKFVAAAGILAMVAVPAHAQTGGGRRHHDEDSKSDKRPKVDEKAYKAALEKIPEPKEKYDPWGAVRPTDPAKKPK